ncbi:NAD-dependent epimerase/dehydratase family protein [Mycolicibacterium vaccae]|uniref:Nucleoside-diphosphate-sugar epimerase n=1 Tax=Mycolicibacterium vaccae ATCC 25954 TaxID=1194972 RepID=K0VKF2_MYCVA|nr:NAD-dependent epimerase/dehydratase family protein [Mycolicibacterium vaccae]ANI42132.1 dehydrogenase [Mycolicibacterium vaccae 95051]EJZ11604.1 nucleoside-diphosphate-sugar epimerase [Mycolicibacterium vaccae ATCC 25954]MCV7060627.1 NAD-dependent epimerase/dehydratase family protein [Mycolicibacterium vaccae]
MHIAVTGGIGYLGAHTVRALLEAQHRIRLLVLPQEQDAPVIGRLRALGEVDVVVGDVRDESTVTALLTGVDAVVHAAGVVGTDERRAQLMWDINAHATEHVLTRAVDLGLDPVVSVSSYSALFPPPDGVISADSPTSDGRSTYAKTKGYADRVARRLQDTGAPVVVTYPSSVVGAAFGGTAVGVTERGWAPIVRARVAPRVRAGMQMIDVRDVADVHTRLMRPGRGPRRYVCGGVMLTFDEMIDALEEGLGRPVRRIPLSPKVLLATGRLSDAFGRYVPLGDGLSYEAALLLTAATPTDDRATTEDLGLTWRSPHQAIVESFRPSAGLPRRDGVGQQ